MNRLLFASQWLVISALLIAGIVSGSNYYGGYSDLNILSGTLEFFIGTIILEIIILIDILNEKEQKKK